ncbi:MAG: pyridoxal-phosphate dependent enzyme [Solirubrobacterales bacterium]|nr:pyridoxal-phosphate dependent enzyme [Solirubrobacterales bacterium]
MRALVNPGLEPSAVPAPSTDARAFHATLPGYAPTPVRDLPAVAAELGLAAVGLKDEGDRLVLPAFKVLGAAWAVERALREHPGVHTLVAASAGNHGRAVARVAAWRGLACRIYLPARAAPARRAAIEAEGAEVVVLDAGYEEAVARAAADGREHGVLELADVGHGGPADWVTDGYATLFAELDAPRASGEGPRRAPAFDLLLVPAGVGSLAAAAARYGAHTGVTVVAVEPATAACLTASLEAGEPTAVPAPGTCMAGLDCAEISLAAWPSLRAGIAGTVTVTDDEARAAMRELAANGLRVGDCGAAPLAALRALATDPACAALHDAVALGPATRAVLIGTEGVTDPDAYAATIAGAATRTP